MEHAKQLFLVSMVSQIKETNLCVCAKSFWQSSKEPAYQRGRLWRCRFDPWVGKIPWRRARQPTPVALPAESLGQRSLVGYGS